MVEKWREIPGFPKYHISDRGRVKSYRWADPFDPHPKGRMLRLWRETPGPLGLKVTLRSASYGGKHFPVALLVMEAFGPRQPEGYTVSHKNGDTTDNRIENLKWVKQ